MSGEETPGDGRLDIVGHSICDYANAEIIGFRRGLAQDATGQASEGLIFYTVQSLGLSWKSEKRRLSK